MLQQSARTKLAPIDNNNQNLPLTKGHMRQEFHEHKIILDFEDVRGMQDKSVRLEVLDKVARERSSQFVSERYRPF